MFFPLTHSHSGSIIITGPHIHVLEATTGKPLASTTAFEPSRREPLLKSGAIRCSSVDTTGTHLATVSEDKRLKVWRCKDLNLLSERELPKKPTALTFTSDGQTILAADKFGDVFRYPLHPTSPTVAFNAETELKKENPPHPKNSLVSHPSTSDGSLVLGHASPLTGLLLTPDDKFIITSDRDEHIRVSWYPQGYNIESYCLGSSQFVSALHIPPSHPSILVSGGGDPHIFLWDWMTGKQKHAIPILDAVTPYLRVKVNPSSRRKWGRDEEDGGGGISAQPGKKKKGGTIDEEDIEPENDGNEMAVDEPELTVLAINKIESVNVGDRTTIVFTATGGTALFSMPFPEEGARDSVISSIPFGQPILDFAIVRSPGGPSVLVSLDQNYGHVESSSSLPRDLVKVGLWSDGSKLTPLPQLEELINSSCRVSASASDLASLDLYSALLSLPKIQQVEQDGVNPTDDAESTAGGSKVIGAPSSVVTGFNNKSGRSKKQAGRLKNKVAVMEKQQVLDGQAFTGDIDERDGLDAKRSRSGKGDDIDVPNT